MNKIIGITGLLLTLSIAAQANELSIYDFQDQTLNARYVTGVTASAISLGSGLNQDVAEIILNNENSFGFGSEDDGEYTLGGNSHHDVEGGLGFAQNHDDLSEAISVADYLEFSIAPNVVDGYVDLTSLTFQYHIKSEQHSADHYAIFYSADGFDSVPDAEDALVTYTLSSVDDYELQTIDLSSVADVTGTATFRIYMYGGGGSPNGFTGFDDITLNGTVIPEPASLGLIVAAGCGVLFVRRIMM